MSRFFIATAVALSLCACGGGTNPFDSATDGSGDDSGSSRTMPPGTESPSASSGIYRTEPTSDDDTYLGNGYATDISYDATKDTFTVDNLAFDGDNEYSRGTAVSTLGSGSQTYKVYEADTQYTDPNNNKPVTQFTHRAIYGVSTSGNTKFAIVRTGAYAGYGFGGFLYQRDGGVTLPTTGQAVYTGTTAGIRDFDGASGLEYTTADLSIAIDFDDFNESTGTRGDAVQGTLSNRKVFDINGNDITDTVLARINADQNVTLVSYPVANFKVGPGVLDDNGELIGELSSQFINSNGEAEVFETGTYYAIISGDSADEIVGVMVLENSIDPIADSVRETSGFIVYR